MDIEASACVFKTDTIIECRLCTTLLKMLAKNINLSKYCDSCVYFCNIILSLKCFCNIWFKSIIIVIMLLNTVLIERTE